MRDDREWLQDIWGAIDSIERYAAPGKEAFEHDELVQIWIVYHLQVIGEAASRLGDDLRNRHPEVPWRRIIAIRNALVHGYFGLDLQEVWMAVERDLPKLKQQVKNIQKVLEESR